MSHSHLLGKYLEAPDFTARLKGIIKGEDNIGGACALHFDILQVP